MLKSSEILDIMLHCVPSWSDIRKRTNKSNGGRLLKAYANVYDDIQEAIDDYVKDFFLVSYLGKENDYIDYLMVGLVGNLDNLSLETPELEITTDLQTFYKDWSSYAYYKDGYIFIHPDAFKNLENCVYKTEDSDGDTYKYSIKLMRRHIWNVFDEFALFAGITRYDGETNAELTQRILIEFQRFSNASEQGLKNAIKNAVHNYDIITDDDIIIEQPTSENLSLEDIDYNTVYDRLAAFNQDIFRYKQWDKSLWFHEFKTTKYLPHKWDQEIPLTQNGVGSNNSLYVDYIQNIGEKDYTNVNVYGYQKSEKAIKEYIRNNNIETSLSLKLDKYKDSIKAEEIQYKIIAKPIVKINPDAIRIEAQQQLSGEGDYYLSDLVTSSENIVANNRGALTANKKYRLEFTPKEAYSAMHIYKCLLKNASGEQDLRTESGAFVMHNGILQNQNVLAHITNTSELLSYNNLINTKNGLTMGITASSAKAVLDVTNMGNKLLVVKVNCPKVDITSNSKRVSASGNFVLDEKRNLYYDNTSSHLSAVAIDMTCNSYSFHFDGAVEVTTIVDNVITKRNYSHAQTVSASFRTATKIQIHIRKDTDQPVTIDNIQASSYEIVYTLTNKNVIDNGKSVRLPSYVGKNTLTIELKAGTQYAPTIEYIHIGPAISGNASTYAIEFNTNSMTSPLLDIESTCKVSLYDITSGKKLISNDYITKTLYSNTTNQNGYLLLDTSNFIEIRGSQPLIQERYKNGAKSYIVVPPHSQADKITIDGEFLKSIESRTLSYYLCDNNSTNKEVYVSTEPYFIVRDTSTNQDTQKVILREDLNPIADTFKVTNYPNTVTSLFRLTNDSVVTASSVSNNFTSLCLQIKNLSESVAYNSALILQPETTGVEIINTFTPLIDLSTLYLYLIDSSLEQTGSLISFNGKSWSLGIPTDGITILSELDYSNKSSYDLSVSFLNGRYILHNQIPLESRYSIGGEIQELAKFIITPQQDGFQISYEEQLYEEEITVGTTGFTKLLYSNIVKDSVSIAGVPASDYMVLGNGEEGILVWKNKTHNNQKIVVTYRYKNPLYIYYNDATVLYNLIQYNISAYDPIGTLTLTNLRDNDEASIQFESTPDIILTKCSNNSFETLIENSTLSVHQIRNKDTIAIHNGWLYDDGLEYWHFNDQYVDSTDRFSNVTLHNVVRFNGELLFHIRSKNYLPYSNMAGNNLYKLCDFDFTKRRFKNVSRFNSYTACDSYNGWILHNFSLTLTTKAYNAFGLEFKNKDSTRVGYAALDITPYIQKNHIISLWTSGDLKVYLATETQYDGFPFARSLCIEEKNLELLSKKDAFWYKIIKNNPIEDIRYYLLISGSNGTIDDLIDLPYTNIADAISSHKKNIDKLRFYIEEDTVKNREYPLVFDYNNALYDNIEYNHEFQTLRNSTNIVYGLTKIADIIPNQCRFIYAQLTKNQIITHDKAIITTPNIYVKSSSLVHRLYIKINNFQIDDLKDFTIKVYAGNSNGQNFIKIFEGSNINIAEIPSDKLKSYIQVEILADKGKIIDNIEVYARYKENENIASLIPVEQQHTSTFISKIYDLGVASTYIWDSIDAEIKVGSPNAAKIFLRAAREDNKSFVWDIDWKSYNNSVDDDYKTMFPNCRLFQYKIELDDSETEIKLNSINLKAV